MYSLRIRIERSNPLVWFISLKLIDKIILLLAAVLILSPVGPHILYFKGFIVEPVFFLLVILLLIYRPPIFRELADVAGTRHMVLITIFLGSCLLVGVYKHRDFSSAYSDFRTVWIFFFSFFFFYSRKTLRHSLSVLYVLALLSAVLYLLVFLTEPFEIRPESTPYPYRGETGLVQAGFPAMASILMMYIASLRRQPSVLVLAIALGAFMALFSFYRTTWLIIGLGALIFLSLMLGNIMLRKRTIDLLLAIIWVGGLVAFALYFSKDILSFLTASELREGLTIGKFEHLWDSLIAGAPLNQSDQLRYSYYAYMFEYWPQLLVPQGLGWEHFVGRIDPLLTGYANVANTLDSGYLFSAIHFGLLFTAAFFVFILYALGRRLKYALSALELLCVLLSLFLGAAYFAVQGEMFIVIDRAFFTGSFLGIVLNWRIREERKRLSTSLYYEQRQVPILPPVKIRW